tara:strand:+ start:2842 stop:5010 length:2169 start_codon:yes stop_codon:yes gene_type:complete
MGATYTRQSSYTDGDVIQAADTNNEFDQLLAAFQASTGHTHDGTANEGGPITKLLGQTLTLGDGTSGADVTVTFDGESNDGVLKWMEDEDYFEFSDDILVATTEKLQFRDTAIYIHSSTDGQLDLIADTEIQIAATTVDINGNVDISGTLTIGSAGISETELEILDGATITTTELNIIDGDTSAGTTAVAGGDGLVTNDGGTMRQTTVDTFDTYLAGTTKTLTNKTIDVDNNTVSNIEVDNLKSGVLDTDLSSVAGTDTTLASAKAIKAYVDAQVTAQDLDFQGDSGGALNIDLDSETLDIAGGTGIDTSGSSNTLTVAIDSTVATLTGSQTLTNKSITAPILTGSASSAGSILFKEDTDNGTNAVTLIGPASTADVTVTLPAATDTLVGKDTTDTLTNKTLTSAVLNSTISGTSIKDEDNMSSNSASHLATQQSIKAYVDSQLTASDLDFQGDSGGALSIDLDSETLDIAGGTGIDTSGSSNTLTVAIDSTVATLTGTQTFTNKSLTAPALTGSSSAAGSILFKEDTDNGTNAVTLIGPASTADVTVTLPASTGTVALTSDIASAGISSGNVATFTSGAADDDFLRIDGTAIEGRSAAEVLSDIGGQAALTFGISNTNAVKIDSASVADDEFARFTANGLESRSATEVRSDIGLGTAAVAATGISNGNVAVFTSGAADNDFLRIDGTSIEGRSASEVLSDIGATTAALAADEATALAIALG